jgi:hypothetical protein
MAIAVVLGFAVPGPASAADCLPANTPGQTIVGFIDTLKGIQGKALIVRPVAPVCLSAPDEKNAAKPSLAIHVYAQDDELFKMMDLIRTEVRLTGRLFRADSLAHKAPIVMEVTKAEPN